MRILGTGYAFINAEAKLLYCLNTEPRKLVGGKELAAGYSAKTLDRNALCGPYTLEGRFPEIQ
jgi:hypothetical protein